MQLLILSPHGQSTALLYVHRRFFARAMLDSAFKPLSSPYASSVLAAYASSITLLKIIREYFAEYEGKALRMWVAWAQGLTAAVCSFPLFTFKCDHDSVN